MVQGELDLGVGDGPSPVPDVSEAMGWLEIPKGTPIIFGSMGSAPKGPWQDFAKFMLIEVDRYELIRTPHGFWLRHVKEKSL